MTTLFTLKTWPKTAVSLLILALFSACTVAEARPTPLPTETAATVAATAVAPTQAATTIEIASPTPTRPLSEPTAVQPRYIEPTPTPTPDYPPLPTENSLNFTLQNQIGGMPQAVLVDGPVAYLAVGPRLVAVDVADPTAPNFLGQSAILGDTLLDIAQEGSFIFGAAGRAGLVVLDVSDPANIRLLNGGPNYSGDTTTYAVQIAISDGRIFISNVDYTINKGDLIWFDLADDGQPTFAGAMPINEQAMFSATSDLLFFPTKQGIQIVDPQNPTQELSRIGADKEIYQVFTAVQQNLLYLFYLGQTNHFTIYDLTDPTNPQVVPQNDPVSLNFTTEMTGNNNILASSYTFGEFGYCNSQITIIDISEPEAPQKTAEFDPQNCISQIVGSGELLYVAGISGLQIYSTRDPANLELLGHFTAPPGIQTIDDILPGQDSSYVLTSEGRGSIIASLDLNQPNPALLGKSDPYNGNQLLELLGTDQTVVVPAWNSSVVIYDASSPANLTQLYAPPEEAETLGSLHGTALVGSVLYMPMQNQYSFTGNLGVFNLQDPTNPQRVGLVQTGLSTVEALVASDGFLYLLGGYEPRTVVIIDIRQPLEPQKVSSITLPAAATRLAVAGQAVYAMCDGYNCHSMMVIDVADAERPYLINQWQLPFIDVVDSVTVGQRLYIISRDNTVRALDVSKPDQPKVIGSIGLPGWYGRLTAVENTLFVSAGSGGLYILSATP
ncbi:MAG: hypothetical protein H6656_05000 [Ardenticatenaceae bacterium]|nr:hypothetical protein [Ardenticatenaceae bacterium]